MKSTLKEDILNNVDQIAIYERYMGQRVKLGKAIRCPFPGERDRHPSFSIYRARNGNILWKYFTGDKGDVFSFVQKMLNINFKECLHQISQDFIINKNNPMAPILNIEGITRELSKHIITEESTTTPLNATILSTNDNIFSYTYMSLKMSRKDYIQYWSQYGVDITTLDSYDVLHLLDFSFPKEHDIDYSTYIKMFFSNGIHEITQKIIVKDDSIKSTGPDKGDVELRFRGKIADLKIGFLYKNNRMKIYIPYSKNKHFGNTKGSDIYMPNIKDYPIDNLAICAGPKDCISLYGNTGIYGVSLNSESCIPGHDMALQIKELYQYPVTVYDADDTGLEYSRKIYDLHGIPYVNMKEFIKSLSNYFSDFLSEQMVNQMRAVIMRVLKDILIISSNGSKGRYVLLKKELSDITTNVIRSSQRRVLLMRSSSKFKDISDIAKISNKISMNKMVVEIINIALAKKITIRHPIHGLDTIIEYLPIDMLKNTINDTKKKGAPL